MITDNTALKTSDWKLDQKRDIHTRHQTSQRKKGTTPTTHSTVNFWLVLHGETFIVIVNINNTAHDADNHRQPYKQVSNTDIISLKKSLESLDLCTTFRLLYYTISQVTAPHYWHPSTISRYPEGDDLAWTSPHEVFHDQTTRATKDTHFTHRL